MKNWDPLSLSAIRLFIVLLLPLNGEAYYRGEDMDYFSYHCILSRFVISQDYYYVTDATMSSLLLLGCVVLISVPLMFFELELRDVPPENSIQSFAFGTISISTAFSIILSNFVSYYTPYDWMLPDMITAFTWSCILFLAIPIIVRESKLLELHLHKGDPSYPPKRRRPSNYTILGYILGIVASIVPYSLFVFDLTQGHNIALVSNSLIFNQILERHTFSGPILQNRIIFYTQNYVSNLSSSLLFPTHICFIVYLLRYFKGRVKRNTVVAIGLSVAFLPSIYNLIQFLFSIGVVNIPLPFLIFTGFILMKRIPVVKHEISIWDEEPQQKWFEDSRVMEEEGLVIVKVPLRYLILSKLRGLRANVKSSQIKLETEKIHDEEIWSD
ncbi:MAG: hypothetical protein ACFFEF_01315 [Candidatus Thorarchaeota archaeon]